MSAITRTRAAVAATALAAGCLTPLALQTAAHAATLPNGHYCAIYDGVAVRTQPDGTARDNLMQDQTFQVESSGDRWVQGYKIVNGVHGYVLGTSLRSC